MIYFLDEDGGSVNINGKSVWLEYDIANMDYLDLLNVCFMYSSYFTLLYRKKGVILKNEPVPYKVLIKTPDEITGYNSSRYFERRFYCCNDQSKIFLSKITNSLFSLSNLDNENDLPEDLTFYRANGTAFFWSMTHEGICVLSNCENEDVSMVVTKQGWKSYDPKIDEMNYLIPKYFIEL